MSNHKYLDCLIFAINFHLSDNLPDFSPGSNANDNFRNISGGLNFADEKFGVILRKRPKSKKFAKYISANIVAMI